MGKPSIMGKPSLTVGLLLGSVAETTEGRNQAEARASARAVEPTRSSNMAWQFLWNVSRMRI